MIHCKQNHTLKSICFFLIWFSLKTGVTGDDLEYGEFNIVITKSEVCQGPKAKSCSHLQIGTAPGGRSLKVSLEVTEDTKPEVGKILVSSTGLQKSSMPPFRMKMDNPCEHMFLRPLFNHLLNLTDSCVVKKGQYRYNVDVGALAENYFGGKFMFGEFSFKSVFTSKKCNFSCARVDVSLTPKQ